MNSLSGASWDQATIARIEKGARRIHLNDAFLLAAIFGHQIEDLLEGLSCEECKDFPPEGFTCTHCGAAR
jgi:hypothetical protein